MKRSIALLLTIAMLFTLCSCGNSAAETGSTAASQTASGPEPVKAEDPAQPAGSAEKTEQPDNSDEREALLQSLNGDWISLYNRMNDLDDEVLTISGLTEDKVTFSESGDRIEAIYGDSKVIDADGIPLLSYAYTYYIKEQDYQTYFDSHFVKVEITGDNIGDYLGDFVKIGYLTDDWGEIEEKGPVYRFVSRPYEDGLVFLSAKDFKMEVNYRRSGEEYTWDYDTPYDCIVLWDNFLLESEFVSFGRAKGTLLFARADYVADNLIDPKTDTRLVRLKDGQVFQNFFSLFDYSKSTVDYEDNKF